MRVVSWVFVLCTALGVVGVFLPSIEAQVGGRKVTSHTQVSLYKAGTQRELVRRLLAAYHASSQRKTGAEIVRTIAPKVQGRLRSALDDARDAMDTLDDTSDDDVRTVGTAVRITTWTLLGLDALLIVIVFTQLMRGVYWRGRLIAAFAISLLVTAISLGVHIVCREVVWQANDEVGRTVLGLAPGAYVLPIAAIGTLIAAIVLLIQRRRAVTLMQHNRSPEFSPG